MAKNQTRSRIEENADPRVLHPLRKLRGMIRSYVGIETSLFVLLFLVIWFWVGLLLDWGTFKVFTFDWVQETPKGLRVGALIAPVLALLIVLGFKLIYRLTKEFSYRSLALVLERRFPKLLGDRLITAVELADVKRQERYGYSGEMIRKTIDEARDRVDQAPVSQVFNWSRLRRQGYLFLGLSLGLFVLVWAIFSAAFQIRLKTYVNNFTDVASIWFERNILLNNTTWPRKSYLELVNFPADGELRIGQGQQPPKLRVQAFKWVWADSRAPEGWRPLTWADLAKALPGEKAPDLPIATLRAAQAEADVQDRVANWLTAFPFAAQPGDVATSSFSLPSSLASVPNEPAQWTVDQVEALFKENKGARELLDQKLGASAVIEYENLFMKLEQRASESSMTRTLRMLVVPNDVRLSYRGLKTSVDMPLRQEAGNEYVASLSDLRETVDFRVRGEDYVTPRKRLTLVPAPAIIDLQRTEERPAYLYHRPVLDESRRPIPYAPEKIKGLKQLVANQPISLTGDSSRFDIPLGTDIYMSASVDKDLEKAWVVMKPGKYPKIDPNGDVVRVELKIDPDRRTVHPVFTAAAGNSIEQATTFELEFKDTDGVSSRRAISVYPFDDRGPEVEVVVEVIRKVGATYLCTPKAMIPFAKESRVRDLSGGINKIEYTFSYTQLESVTDIHSKAAIISLFFHNTPQMPSFAQGFYKAGMVSAFAPTLKSGKATVEQSVPLESFVERYREPGFLTVEKLKEKLKLAPPSADELPMITNFEFGPSGERGFDIQTLLPGLLEKDANKPQPHYALTLNVTATDSNVETGPKTATNKEPLVFRIVSEAELLSEISREESELGAKLDEVLRRLNDSENKLSGILSRVPSIPATAKDDFIPEQTRSSEIMESMAKARDITTDVATAYTRILEEYRTNRFTPSLTDKLASRIVGPLDSVLKNEFPRWDEAHNTLNARLAQSAAPEPDVLNNARLRMSELVAKMRQIRLEIGEVIGFNKLLSDAQKIYDRLIKEIGPGIKEIGDRAQNSLFAPRIIAPPLVSLTQGQKATLNVELDWLAPIEGIYSWQIVVPAESGIKTPGRIDIKGTPQKMPFEITAGTKPGEYTLQIVPSAGTAVSVKISVK